MQRVLVMIIELNDKSDLTYDELMQTPDTPAVAS